MVPEKLMSIPDYYKSLAVFEKAYFKELSITFLENFLILLCLSNVYSIFYGNISLTKSDTKCPFTPWPSQTPNKYLFFIMKFSIRMYVS